MSRKFVLTFGGLVLIMLALVAGAASAQDSCADCHNDTTIITGPETAWAESGHGMGEAYVRGTSAGCAGCHSGGGFSAMVAAGLTPDTVEAGDPHPTRQDCRTCHNIHVTYAAEDWSLETTDAVTLYAFEDVIFDGDQGSLCANCHQPRRMMEVVDGMVNVDSTHWGPHHGPQSAMLLGVGGALEVESEGRESEHYRETEQTCVTCHVANANHTFEPTLNACLECHEEAESFDMEGVQTQVDELVVELQDALVANGLLAGDAENGFHPVVGEYPEAQAGALWNYIFIVIEDSSHGAHNGDYTIDLLEASIEALK
jgi:mono/diheme cytochrome c family protein